MAESCEVEVAAEDRVDAELGVVAAALVEWCRLLSMERRGLTGRSRAG